MEAFEILKRHFGTSSQWGGGRRTQPYAFTEQGHYMTVRHVMVAAKNFEFRMMNEELGGVSLFKFQNSKFNGVALTWTIHESS